MKWEDWTSYYFTCDCVLESISRQNIELYMRYAKTRTEYLSNVLVPGFPLMFYWAAKEKTIDFERRVKEYVANGLGVSELELYGRIAQNRLELDEKYMIEKGHSWPSGMKLSIEVEFMVKNTLEKLEKKKAKEKIRQQKNYEKLSNKYALGLPYIYELSERETVQMRKFYQARYERTKVSRKQEQMRFQKLAKKVWDRGKRGGEYIEHLRAMKLLKNQYNFKFADMDVEVPIEVGSGTTLYADIVVRNDKIGTIVGEVKQKGISFSNRMLNQPRSYALLLLADYFFWYNGSELISFGRDSDFRDFVPKSIPMPQNRKQEMEQMQFGERIG